MDNIEVFLPFSYILCAFLTSLVKKQVLLRLIGADETMYTGSSETMKWLEDTNVLDLIVDKFSSSVWPYFYLFFPKKNNPLFNLIQLSRYLL